MPLFHYACANEHSVKKYFRQVAQAPASLVCEVCQSPMKKLLSPPSSTSKIIVDNGFQARQVEINPDIIEINQARSNKDYRED